MCVDGRLKVVSNIEFACYIYIRYAVNSNSKAIDIFQYKTSLLYVGRQKVLILKLIHFHIPEQIAKVHTTTALMSNGSSKKHQHETPT